MQFTSNEIHGFDYVQHYVGNAKHSAQYYSRLFGFQIVGYRGPETGVRDRVSYLLQQNDLTFVVTAAIVPDHPISAFTNRHGDGVSEISIRVADPRRALEFARSKGATVVAEPTTIEDEFGRFHTAGIQIYGNTVLSLVNREEYRWVLPGFRPTPGRAYIKEPVGLLGIDHIVGNVAEGQMNYWAEFFERVLDLETFIHFDKGDISTKYSALVSKVVRSKNNAVKFPINEPAEGLRKSQIDEYLETNSGPGVQHLAIASNDIVHSIEVMRANGVEFIETPASYYDVMRERAIGISETVEDLRRLNILLDRDDLGYLLQLFTAPVGDRPTLFFEFIQRKGSQGFGQNNFQALFEAIEREQAKRGNL